MAEFAPPYGPVGAPERLVAIARYLMLDEPGVANSAIASILATRQWQDEHGSLVGRWWGAAHGERGVTYHRENADGTGVTQFEPPDEPVAVVIDVSGRPLSDLMRRQYGAVRDGTWPHRPLTEPESVRIEAAVDALSPGAHERWMRTFGSRNELAGAWHAGTPLPDLAGFAWECHTAGELGGAVLAGVIGAYRICAAIPMEVSTNADFLASRRAAAGPFSRGDAHHPRTLVDGTVAAAVEAGHAGTVLRVWEEAYEEFDEGLRASSSCPDLETYLEALYAVRPLGMLALWTGVSLLRYASPDASTGERLTRAGTLIEENAVRCSDAWLNHVNDLLSEGDRWRHHVAVVAAAGHAGGSAKAREAARTICRARRLYPLAYAEDLVAQAAAWPTRAA
ncbi:hypothetical protein [Yinghuangia soli]|uniref:Uncharacterized protein n=1 Tax=Yinghuangia soli TaxID=2908204 RepID=A0AA41PWW3_9ACTN|nr:hypothetical protein [Yinghuangia soli]MCF2527062.1 hypothetical protein [Yinghuangia soli]